MAKCETLPTLLTGSLIIVSAFFYLAFRPFFKLYII